MKMTQEELLAKINAELIGDDKISDPSHLHKLRNLQRGLSDTRIEAIRKHMGKEAGLLWDFRPENESLKKENDSLKVEIYNLTSYKRQYSRTAMPAFFTFLFIISLFCFFVTAHEVWRPSIELAVSKKHRNEKYESDIKSLNETIESKVRIIAGCDEAVAREKREYDDLWVKCKAKIEILERTISELNEKMMMGD